MKILHKIFLVLVCLSLVSTLGCSKTPKNGTSSPSLSKSATAKSNSTSKSTGTTTSTAAAAVTTTAKAENIATAVPVQPVNAGPFHGGFASETPLLFNAFNVDATAETATAIQLVSPEETLAGQFFATTDFTFIQTCCPTYGDAIGNMTLSIYNWNVNYETTISGKVLKSHEFVNFKDNEWLQLTFDAALPAGEYLWVLSNPSDVVGIWSTMEGPANLKCYKSGELVDTFHDLKIQYTKTPNITLGALSK